MFQCEVLRNSSDDIKNIFKCDNNGRAIDVVMKNKIAKKALSSIHSLKITLFEGEYEQS